jgi:hypothetical protein
MPERFEAGIRGPTDVLQLCSCFTELAAGMQASDAVHNGYPHRK